MKDGFNEGLRYITHFNTNFQKKKKKQAQNLNALITDLFPYYLIPMKYLKKLRITVYINLLERIT